MCGIIGAFGVLPKEDKFLDARDSMSTRGPDDKGVLYDEGNNIALGHTRLSIIDLTSSGHQPMFSNDGRYCIVFNGEIYNYLELKEELKDKYSFKTGTDTEVLLASYSVWGEGALSKLNGMFSFAIWDKEKRELFCARDRLGIKPFYYALDDDTLYISSEIKGLLKMGVGARVNDRIIYDYLAHGYYDHTEETFFDGIKNLSAGSQLTYKDGNMEVKSYWDLANIVGGGLNISKEDAKKRFLEIFRDSIRLRLRSDVPVGVNISSGLDSAGLLFFAENESGSHVNTFSMCSVDIDYDECKLLEPMLTNAQIDKWNTSTLQPEEVQGLLDEVLESQDEPYGGIPTISYHQLARCAKENGVTVVLEGQGGDELFAGYSYYREEFLNKNTSGLSQDTSKEINTSALNEGFLRSRSSVAEMAEPFESPLLNAQYRDLKYTKLPRVLRFNDRISMAFSLEYREPFLDHRLVEFAFSIPDEYKIDESGQKVILREAFEGVVPLATRKRTKKAFGAIQTPWFRKYLKSYILGILKSESFRRRKYWDQEKVLDAANKFFDGEGDNSFYIWQWVNLELWFRRYID